MQDSLIARRKRELARRLTGGALRFATAESCTGGALAGLLAGDAKLGSHLDRGFVAYSIDAKCDMLGVTRATAERCEGVNPEVAAAMASAALARSDADFAVAITGFCGPQEKNEEVGLIFLAIDGRDGTELRQECHFGDLGRQAVLDEAIAAALGLMIEAAR